MDFCCEHGLSLVYLVMSRLTCRTTRHVSTQLAHLAENEYLLCYASGHFRHDGAGASLASLCHFSFSQLARP